MTPVSPTKKTTLLLNAAFQPYKFITARNAIYNLATGGIRAVDSFGNINKWDEWCIVDHPEDQPSLRSSASEWAVPTVAVIPGFFKTAADRSKVCSSLRQIFFLYDCTCQYCLKQISFSQASKDHLLPKSRGGKNADTNIVLACKRCNRRKGSKYPYTNVENEMPKIRSTSDFTNLMKLERVTMRPEWEFYIGK